MRLAWTAPRGLKALASRHGALRYHFEIAVQITSSKIIGFPDGNCQLHRVRDSDLFHRYLAIEPFDRDEFFQHGPSTRLGGIMTTINDALTTRSSAA
jgi:hypothetical protein